MAIRSARLRVRLLNPSRSGAVTSRRAPAGRRGVVVGIGVLAAVGIAASVAPTLASAAPHSEPSATSLQRQLGELAVKNSQLVEQYDQAQVRAQKTAASARTAQASAAHAAAQYSVDRQQLVQIIEDQYQTNGFGAAGALLESTSNANYVQRLTSLGVVSEHMSSVVTSVGKVRDQAASSAATATKLAAQAKTAQQQIAAQRNTVNAQIAKYKSMLATLTSAEQYTYNRIENPSVSLASTHLNLSDPAVSPKAAIAVQFALKQLGKPYVFGASGPGSYDCSGLTMASWQAAGVSLPHSAADQYNYGTHVSRQDLEPGDLLFYYTPIGHVTIYAGDGMMVSAPTEGENVSLVPVAAFDSDYVGATRLS